MPYHYRFYALFCISVGAFSFQIEEPSGPFLGLGETAQPQIVFPNKISTAMGEYNGVFSPEGDVFYYTASLPGFDAVVEMRLRSDGSWTDPAISPFSGIYPDFDPMLSPSGEQLFFSSRRPSEERKAGGKSAVWVMDKQATGWGKPRYLALARNDAYYNSVTLDGKIYFSTRSNEHGFQNIHCAIPAANGYVIQDLGTAINSDATDVDPFVSPDERFLIFRSFRPGGLGGADLYISFRKNGEWQKAKNLGAPINSPAHESCPFVTLDERLMIFASNRMGRTFYDTGSRNLETMLKKYQSHDNGRLNIYSVGTHFLNKR